MIVCLYCYSDFNWNHLFHYHVLYLNVLYWLSATVDLGLVLSTTQLKKNQKHSPLSIVDKKNEQVHQYINLARGIAG